MSDVRETKISFYALRALVIAASRYSEITREKAITFSEGNATWDLLEVANDVDDLISDSESEQQFLIVREDVILEERKELEALRTASYAATRQHDENLRKKTELVDRIKVSLGTFALTDAEMFDEIDKLVAKHILPKKQSKPRSKSR